MAFAPARAHGVGGTLAGPDFPRGRGKGEDMTRAITEKKRKTTHVAIGVNGDGKAASLPADELRKIDAYWNACNYLSAGMIYLRDNPLLRKPLKPEHVKTRLLG